MLKYDETLEKISLSTGTPKTDENLIETVYLRVLHNTISDMVEAETKDLCPVNVTVSYRVNFEGDSKIWFNVENYVKFLTDHLRSVIRNKIKQVNIEDFYANNISIIRDTVLGEHKDDSRKGKKFEENGVRVYDIEVLGIEIDDTEIFDLLVDSEHENIEQKLSLVRKERELQNTKQTEKIQREIDTAESETLRKKYELNVKDSEKELESELAKLRVESQSQKQVLIDSSEQKDIKNQIDTKTLEIEKATQTQSLEYTNSQIEQEIKKLTAETTSMTDKAKAVNPDLLLVLQEFANKDLAGKLAENLNVLSILGGKGKTGIQILQELLGGSGLGNLISEKINLHLHPKRKSKETNSDE